MNVQELLSKAIIGAFEAEGVDRLAMVLRLSDELGVRDQIQTTEEANASAAAQVRGALANQPKAAPISDGDTVMTAQGEARAVVLTTAEKGLLDRLFAAAKLGEEHAQAA